MACNIDLFETPEHIPVPPPTTSVPSESSSPSEAPPECGGDAEGSRQAPQTWAPTVRASPERDDCPARPYALIETTEALQVLLLKCPVLTMAAGDHRTLRDAELMAVQDSMMVMYRSIMHLQGKKAERQDIGAYSSRESSPPPRGGRWDWWL